MTDEIKARAIVEEYENEIRSEAELQKKLDLLNDQISQRRRERWDRIWQRTKDIGEPILFVGGVIAVIAFGLWIGTIPFWIIGWALTIIAEVFGATVAFGYFKTAGLGLAVIIIAGLILFLRGD